MQQSPCLSIPLTPMDFCVIIIISNLDKRLRLCTEYKGGNMKSIVTARDMSLMGKIFKFTAPESIPLSFRYKGKDYRVALDKDEVTITL